MARVCQRHSLMTNHLLSHEQTHRGGPPETTETSHTESITVNGGFPSGSTSIALSGGFTWLPAGSFLEFAGDSNLYEILTAKYGAGNVTIEAIANALTTGTSVTLKQKI